MKETEKMQNPVPHTDDPQNNYGQHIEATPGRRTRTKRSGIAVTTANKFFSEHDSNDRHEIFKTASSLTPSQIHRELDRFIIGQEKAKKILSVAVYNHAKRLNDRTGLIRKSNILLVGPSGSGKTLLAQTLAQILSVPFAIVDSTTLTQTGYIGSDVDTCLRQLLTLADGDIHMAQNGIVYIDEIDKIARKKSWGRDISGEGVQSALLKLIEGSKVSIPTKEKTNYPGLDYMVFDTSNVLFICGGAFEGLSNNTKNRPIGFCPSSRTAAPETLSPTPEQLITYGMTPEFIGRLPIICRLDELSERDLVRVLTEPDNALIKEYQLLFEMEGINLNFTDDALRKIAGMAAARNTGARGLRSLLEDVMLDIMYEIPDCNDSVVQCTINKESITTKKPVLIRKKPPAMSL